MTLPRLQFEHSQGTTYNFRLEAADPLVSFQGTMARTSEYRTTVRPAPIENDEDDRKDRVNARTA